MSSDVGLKTLILIGALFLSCFKIKLAICSGIWVLGYYCSFCCWRRYKQYFHFATLLFTFAEIKKSTMLDDERESIIEKALKIREYANRGVGGEKTNAIRMLAEYKEKHNITDDEMNLIKSYGNSWYDSVPKEERGTPFNKWFRRSVTTYIDKDDKDKIMVFYHKSRTQIPFNEFDHDKGIKFSDKNNYGFHFLFEEDKRYIHHIGHDHNGTGVEFYVYLRMVNPYYLYSRLDGNSYGQQGEQYRPIKIYKLLVEGLIHLGYDSIIIQDELGINVYIVFHPNQIKSINNKGEYSMNNNDIFS